MAYTKQTWVRGEKVASAKLNHMEDGIDAISANGAIGTANLAPAAVTNDKLDQEAVDSDNIRTGAIITPLIYNGAVTKAKIDSGAYGAIASVYDNTKTYDVGDYVIYNNDLYRCITAITTAESWTAAHWAAAVLGDDVADLKSALDDIDGYFEHGINLFNPNDPDFVENVELKNSGATSARTGYFASGYIPVKAGKTVCVNYPTGTYGSASSIVFYDAQKQRTGYTNPSRYTDSRGLGYLKYTISESATAAYFRVTGYMARASEYMYVYADDMPSTYEPYTDYVTLANGVKVPFANVQYVMVDKSQTDFVKIAPKNLNDMSKMVVGIIKNSSSNGDLDSTVTNWYSTDFIPVEAGKVYKLVIMGGVYYGSGFKGIVWYKADKSYGGHIVPAGGISTSGVVDTITIPSGASYIRVSYRAQNITNPKLWYVTQIFEGDVWTGMYIKYDGEERLQGIGLMPEYSKDYNCLYGKKAMWNGDSICAADNDAQGGWAFRIGAANGMYAKNYAVAGRTIAENTGTNVRSVSATLDGMITDFPDADYIIIEGGTNDADLIGDSGIGTFDADDFTDAYIEALDKDTFSGALESIFYRLVTQMKGKHIGYLIPQKMGHTEVLVARRRTYFDRAISIAQKWGIPVLDLWNNLYFNWRLAAHWNQEMSTTENENAGNLYVDGQHLTTTGYAIQSPIIAEWMKTL